MGRVTAFELVGVECWFYSQDHRPPHFHARKRGKWHVKVLFMEAREAMIETLNDLGADVTALEGTDAAPFRVRGRLRGGPDRLRPQPAPSAGPGGPGLRGRL